MFSGSTGELALIFLLTLLVFGPDRLPGLARNLGKLVRHSKMLMQSLWGQLDEEIDRGEKNSRISAAAAVLEREGSADACRRDEATASPAVTETDADAARR